MLTSDLQRNWAGNRMFGSPPHRPESVNELRRLVAGCRRVRAVGAGHSFSPIVDPLEDLVSLDRLPPHLSVDPVAPAVTVSAAMRFSDFVRELDQAGFALANLASMTEMTVAGACVTATHGSGDGLRCLSDSVTGVEAVGPDGDLVAMTTDTLGADFAGAVVSLGALGVVHRLALRVEPAFSASQVVYTDVAVDEVADDFDAVFGAGYSVSVFTRWHDGLATVVVKRRPDRSDTGWVGRTPLRTTVNPTPGESPDVCSEQGGVVGRWYERLPHLRLRAVPASGDELQSEFFLPRARVRAAFNALRNLFPRIGPVLQVSEIRTVRADDLWLSPAFGRDSCILHCTWVDDVAAVVPAVEAVEEALADLSARPHWAKLTSRPARELAEGYPRLADFRRLRATLDPAGKFSNAFLDELLTP